MSVDEAQKKIISVFEPLGIEKISIEKAIRRVLAQSVFSEINLPLFPNSSMDGFAVRSLDLEGVSREYPTQLEVVDDIPAGKVSKVIVKSGQASRIMTGAPLPQGADSVIPVEDTDQFQHGRQSQILPSRVKVFRSVQSGDYVRQKGEDIRSGECVLPQGKRIRPQEVGLLAMLGMSDIPVFKRPRVAIISTGDELVPINKALEPGQIYDSNTYSLSAQVLRDGGEPFNLGIASDRESAVIEVLEKTTSSRVDLILSTAGVSVGAFDVVKSVVERFGRIEFWRVNMRPGKPVTFGHYQNIPFVGLPGNPVSAYVSYEIFVRPSVYRLSGMETFEHLRMPVRLLDPVESDGRESYLRAIVKRQTGNWTAQLTGHQGSGNLWSLVQANALLVLPSGVKSLPSGSIIDALLLNEVD